MNGLDVKQLLVFLSEVIRIRDLSMLTDSQLLELMFPYCQDALASKVVVALQEGWTFERFHRNMLDSFIPRCLFEQLRREKYDRLKREEEPFALYINSIKAAAVVLRLPVSEREVVNNIVEGLAPAQRSRFVFQKLPTSFGELDRLAVLDQNFAFADHLRQSELRNNELLGRSDAWIQGEYGTRRESFHQQIGWSVRKVKRYYFFQQLGHVQRDCPRLRKE